MASPTLREWADWLEKQARGDLHAAINRELAKTAARAQRYAKVNATRSPRVRSGRLRGSIGSGVRSRADGTVDAFVSANTKYAAAQERGATIHARGRYLTVPLGAVKTRAGVVRRSARDYPGAFVIRSRAGKLLIVQKNGKRIVPLFVLVQSVKVPATHFLRDGMREAAKGVPAAMRLVLQQSATVGGAP